MRRLSAVVILAVTLSLSAFAGQLPFPVNDPPPAPATQPVTVSDGETDSTAEGSGSNQISDEATSNPAAEIVLTIMQSALSLL
jgi:hypothetical protein